MLLFCSNLIIFLNMKVFWYHTIYQSNTRFVHDNSPLTSFQNFRQKENLWKLKTSLTSFIFSSLPIPAGVINFPTMCEQSFLADNVARRMPLKVSADQWRVPTEEKEERKKKRKQSPREFIFCLYCVCTMKITRRYEWTPRYTLAIRSSGFLQGSLKVSLFWNFPLKMFDG